MKIDVLAEPNGYVHNGLPATSDPLKFDESRGRIAAVCYELITSNNLGSDGRNFLEENRIVRGTLQHTRTV